MKFVDNWLFVGGKPQEISVGVYECVRCHATYTVCRADTWNPCTPEFCHDCLAHLNTCYYLESDNVPIH